MARGKFHINDEGRVMPCNAQSGNCPFGGDDQHFDNFEEAQLAADKKNELLTKGDDDDYSSSETQKVTQEMIDAAYEIEELAEGMYELLEQMKNILREVDPEEAYRAESYWMSHIDGALFNRSQILGGSFVSAQETLDSLKGLDL